MLCYYIFFRIFTLNLKTGKKRAGMIPPIQCFVNAGSGLIALGDRTERPAFCNERLPGEQPGGAEPWTYGAYLGTVARLLSRNSFNVLKKILKRQPRPAPELEDASDIRLISEKHGAICCVSCLQIQFVGDIRSFAVNCAFSAEQQAFIGVEVKLLSALHSRFGLPFLPLPFVSAGAPGLKLFVAEWFENHQEFHLAGGSAGDPSMAVWGQDGRRRLLDREKTIELYAQASEILTSYLDSRSFSQIYPWHHAAGDFVIDDSRNPPSLRLTTVRGYRPLLSRKSGSKDRMLGSLHYFVNLSIRMRIDRLDGTGELAWAGPECLAGVIRGFAAAWQEKGKKGGLPEAEEIFALFLALSPDQRLDFCGAVAEAGLVEADEGNFLCPRLPGHVAELSDALENFAM